MPTPEEEQRADEEELDPEAAEHEREMAERRKRQEGDGSIPSACQADSIARARPARARRISRR